MKIAVILALLLSSNFSHASVACSKLFSKKTAAKVQNQNENLLDVVQKNEFTEIFVLIKTSKVKAFLRSITTSQPSGFPPNIFASRHIHHIVELGATTYMGIKTTAPFFQFLAQNKNIESIHLTKKGSSAKVSTEVENVFSLSMNEKVDVVATFKEGTDAESAISKMNKSGLEIKASLGDALILKIDQKSLKELITIPQLESVHIDVVAWSGI